MAKFAVILPAAGQSSRFKDKEKKPFVNLDGRAVWLRSAEFFINRPEVCQCLIVIHPQDLEMFRTRFGANLAFMNVQIVEGGTERFESIANALKVLEPEVDFVAVHDAVRPCLTAAARSTLFFDRGEDRGGPAGVAGDRDRQTGSPQKTVQATLPRQGLWLAQTPQVFRRDWLVQAYADRAKLGKDITDDAQLVEAAGHTVHLVEGASTNIKITTKSDLFLGRGDLEIACPSRSRRGRCIRSRRRKCGAGGG